MNRVTILTLTLLIAVFGLSQGFAVNEDSKSDEQAGPANESSAAETQPAETAEDVNETAGSEPNKTAEDVNAADAEELEAFNDAFKSLEAEARRQMNAWRRGSAENNIRLVQTVHEQVLAELQFLRDIAAGEGASQTTRAIDFVIAKRRQRFDSIVERLQRIREREQKQVDGGRDRQSERDQKSRRREDRPERERRQRD